jgi:hypothetical protein
MHHFFVGIADGILDDEHPFHGSFLCGESMGLIHGFYGKRLDEGLAGFGGEGGEDPVFDVGSSVPDPGCNVWVNGIKWVINDLADHISLNSSKVISNPLVCIVGEGVQGVVVNGGEGCSDVLIRGHEGCLHVILCDGNVAFLKASHADVPIFSINL